MDEDDEELDEEVVEEDNYSLVLPSGKSWYFKVNFNVDLFSYKILVGQVGSSYIVVVVRVHSFYTPPISFPLLELKYI